MKKYALMSILVLFVTVSIFSYLGTPPAVAQEKPIAWKFANYGTSGSPWNELPTWFFQEIEKRSKGRLATKIFVGESLVPMKQAPDSLKVGVCQATVFVPAYYESKMPLTTFISYPYVLPGGGTKGRVRDTFLLADKYFTHQLITKELAKWDAMYICPHAFTQYELAGNKPVRNVGDLKGLRIRVLGPSGPILRKYGAAPVFVTTNEAYEGLQKGTIDLFAHDPYFFHRYKVYEVCKYLIEDFQMGTTMGPFVIKLSAFQALPKDLQKIVLDVKKEALNKFWTTYRDEEAAGRKAARDKGLTVIQFPKEEREKLKQTAKETCWVDWTEKTEKLGLPAKQVSTWILGEIKALGY